MQNHSFSFLARRLTLLWLSLFGATALFTAPPIACAQTQPAWTAADIGGVGQSGSSAYDQQSGAYTMNGGGSGAGANADALHFLSAPLHGNGQIVAHLGGLQGGSSPAAGLMIRESQDASAKMVGLFVAANGSVNIARRAVIADAAQVSASSVTAAANWLKLLRRGDEFVAFSSLDGVNWLLVGAGTVPMTQDVLIGMGASSGDVSSLCSAVFDQVALSRVDAAMLTGSHHGSLALKADGTVWQWGSDDAYSGSPYESPALMQPTQVAGLDHSVAVASGEYHSLALRSDGTVWAWGNNWNGQLGPRVEPNWELPDQVVGLDHVVAVAAAPGLSVALRVDGTVWAWGANYCGQLADGSTADNGTPRQVANLDNVIAIAAGGAHVLALKADGTLWGWGESYAGQVGDGTENALVLTPVQVSGLSNITAMAAGGYHSLAVLADGTVWAWGANWSGQLGDGTSDQHPTPVQITGISDAFAVAAGDAHSLALNSDGTVWAWGANSLGEVGNNSTGDAHAPVQVGGLSDIARIGAGRTHSLAGRLSDGKVWGWGEGYRFKLGDGGQQTRLTPARTASFRLDDGVSPVAEPTVSPVGSGGYDSPGPITIDCATPGAVIRYTLDGSEPTASSTLYTVPLTLTGRFTLKAKAFLPDGLESDLAGVSFAILAPPPTISPAGGLFSMPVTLALASANSASAIHYTLDGSAPDENSPLYTSSFLLGGSAQVQASAFLSDVAPSDIAFANFTIYETAAAPVISPAGAAFDNSTEVTLTSATAGAIIRYTTDGNEPGVSATLYQGPFTSSESMDLKARAFLPGMNASAVVEAQFSENSTVATPILSVPGGVYARAQNAVVSCATPGAEIHYTLDGSEPTLSSPVIISGESVAVTDSFVALIARAWKDGQSVSGLAEADYWINGMVAAGQNHTVALKADGSVWTWGDNGCGQLGSGGYDPSASPIQVQGLSDVVAVTAGLNCSAALKADGTVWAWGLNDRAQLGSGTYDYQSNVPVQIMGLSDVKAIAAGEAHFLALKVDGSVWGWGNDDCGQLGQGATSAPVRVPVQVPGLGHVTGIAAGQSHSLAVRLEGDVWAWGRNDRGQIGDSTYEWRFLPVPVTGVSTAKAVVAGQNHSLALLADGTVQAWGDDVFGQLGDGQGQPPQENSSISVLGLDNVIQLAANGNYSVALKGDGSVWAWGDDSHGQLGDGTTNNSFVPLQLSAMGLVKAVAAGANHALALLDGGSLWSWGDNSSGQLGWSGDGVAPTQVPEFSLVSSGGTLVSPVISPAGGTFHESVTVEVQAAAAGAEIHYTLDGSEPNAGSSIYDAPLTLTLGQTTLKANVMIEGFAPSMAATATFVVLPNPVADPVIEPFGGTFINSVEVSFSDATEGAVVHFTLDGDEPTEASPVYVAPLTITENTIVRAKGFKVGYEASASANAAYMRLRGTPAQIGGLAAGSGQSMALKADGTVWSWGRNDHGQLGIDSFVDAAQPTLSAGLENVVLIASHAEFSYALQANGSLYAWGANWNGQLGDGSYVDQPHPIQVVGLDHVMSAAAGAEHGLAVRTDGSVWSWGANWDGQLGDGTYDRRNQAAQVVGLQGIVSVAAGFGHSLALGADGTVLSWGINDAGQLGDETNEPHLTPTRVSGLDNVNAIAAGDFFSVALKADGTVWTWGSNGDSQLGDNSLNPRHIPAMVPNLDSVVAIAAGAAHVVALKSDGSVWTWGANWNGQLGRLIAGANANVPTKVVGMDDHIVSIGAGHAQSLAQSSDGYVWAWGQNDHRQIGDGGNIDHFTPYFISGFYPLPLRSPKPVNELTTQAGDASVTLNWTASDSWQPMYTVKRSTNFEGPYEDVQAGISNLTFHDQNLVNGTVYYYTVVAVNVAGVSPEHSPVLAQPLAAAPDVLNAVSVTASHVGDDPNGDIDPSAVVIQWAPPPAAVSGYVVERSMDGGATWEKVTLAGPGVLSFKDDSNLIAGQSYLYRVSAIDAQGISTAPGATSTHQMPLFKAILIRSSYASADNPLNETADGTCTVTDYVDLYDYDDYGNLEWLGIQKYTVKSTYSRSKTYGRLPTNSGNSAMHAAVLGEVGSASYSEDALNFSDSYFLANGQWVDTLADNTTPRLSPSIMETVNSGQQRYLLNLSNVGIESVTAHGSKRIFTYQRDGGPFGLHSNWDAFLTGYISSVLPDDELDYHYLNTSASMTIERSFAYSNDDLIQQVIAAAPAYSGEWKSAKSSNLAGWHRTDNTLTSEVNAINFSFEKCQYRMQRYPNGPSKLTWQVVFYPTDGSGNKDYAHMQVVDTETVDFPDGQTETSAMLPYEIVPTAGRGNGVYEIQSLNLAIRKVWCDQIPDVVANYLPGGTGNHDKDYILMGAAQSNNFDKKGHIKVEMQDALPENLKPNVLWRLAMVDPDEFHPFTPMAGSSSYESGNSTVVNVVIDDPPDNDIVPLVLVAGYDSNGDGQLQQGEITNVPTFNRGPNGTIPSYYKVRIISDGSYKREVGYLRNQIAYWGASVFPHSAELLQAFTNNSVPYTATSEPSDVDRLEPGLDFPVGILYNSAQPSKDWPARKAGGKPIKGVAHAGPGATITAVYSPTTQMSKDVFLSKAFSRWIVSQIEKHADYVRGYMQSHPEIGTCNIAFDCSTKNADGYEEGLTFGAEDIDLLFTFGHISATFHVDIEVSNDLQATARIKGAMLDVYDFDYDGILDLSQPASRVQAGYNTLGVAGRVYKSRVEFDVSNVILDFTHSLEQ